MTVPSQDATSEETSATEADDTEAQNLLADALDSEDPDEDSDAEEDKPLGPKGEKALEAEKDKRRGEATRRRAAEKERDDLKAQLAKFHKGATPTEQAETEPPDPDEIRREAERAATEKANDRILRAEVKAAATGKLADPADALRFLDLTQFDVGDDGEIDVDEIGDALDDLIKNKPYLGAAAQGGKRFKGTGDGGAKPTTPQRPQSLSEAVTRRLTPR